MFFVPMLSRRLPSMSVANANELLSNPMQNTKISALKNIFRAIFSYYFFNIA
jgi:hypothetical protein